MNSDGTNGQSFLRGTRVVVTDAAGLIGRRLTYRFAAAGADVVAIDRDVTRLRREFSGVPHILPIPGDVADEVFADDLFAELDGLGRIAALVNNADLTASRVPFLETTTCMFDTTLAASLRAVYLLSYRAARCWARTLSPGTIVNLAPPGAPTAGSLHQACRGGIEALSLAMATELGPLGIRVNCLAPAEVAEFPGDDKGVPLRRRIVPDDVADAALFLASPGASQITGAVLVVDGGLAAQLRAGSTRSPAA
jgi:NAD(P)-dependent dehydrogenase (short-subunit alcohol dehydrogenase family)